MRAGKGQTLTGTLRRAVNVTVPLVVMPRTVRISVTRVAMMKTGLHSPTSVEARTRVLIAFPLVLTVWTVVHPVTTDEHRETVTVVVTLKVALRTLGCISMLQGLVFPDLRYDVILM